MMEKTAEKTMEKTAEKTAEKKRVTIHVRTDLWLEFKRLAFQKHENFHGALSYEVEQALQAWIAQHTQNHTKTLFPNDVNPQPRILKVFSQVKEYLKTQYGYGAIVIGQQIPLKHLKEAIMAIRGTDYRTVKKWMDLFIKFKLIKHIAGQVYEVI